MNLWLDNVLIVLLLLSTIAAAWFFFLSRKRLFDLRSTRDEAQRELAAKEALLQSQSERLDNLMQLQPLRDELQQFNKTVNSCYSEERKEVFALKQIIESLMGAQARTQETAQNLAQALTGNAKLRGGWGELILERVLQASGLTEGRDYVREAKGIDLKDDAGKNRRPDVVVRLPRGKHVIVDAKLNLNSYERLLSHRSGAEVGVDPQADAKKNVALKATFVQAVKAQIADLAGKDYRRLRGLQSPEFVFLFVPVESAFLFLLDEAPEVYEMASHSGVILCSPTNLVVALKLVAQLWNEERQNDNARQIAHRAGKLYDKFALCMTDLTQLGRHLEQAADAHSSVLRRWTTGRGSVTWQVEELKRLGASTLQQIPLATGETQERPRKSPPSQEATQAS